MTDIAVQRNGLASEADEKYADYQDSPTPQLMAELIALIPSLVAEIDEAQRWAITARRHREGLASRNRELRAELDKVRSQMDDARYSVDQVLAKRDEALAELDKVRAQLADTQKRAHTDATNLQQILRDNTALANEVDNLRKRLEYLATDAAAEAENWSKTRPSESGAALAALCDAVKRTAEVAQTAEKQEPCDICSGYGCPDCRNDLSGVAR